MEDKPETFFDRAICWTLDAFVLFIAITFTISVAGLSIAALCGFIVQRS